MKRIDYMELPTLRGGETFKIFIDRDKIVAFDGNEAGVKVHLHATTHSTTMPLEHFRKYLILWDLIHDDDTGIPMKRTLIADFQEETDSLYKNLIPLQD